MATELWAIGVALANAVIASFAQLLFKKGAHDLTRKPWNIIKSKNLMFGIIIYVAVTIPGVIAYHYGDLSVIYPIFATSYIWVALLSRKYLKEKMNLLKWLGIASIIVGVALIGFGAIS
ncbi:MAG: EamA family transporter [Nanoarchaeota archaeon]|nr:EamA family transporter [Nanoarchaeota archaeon]